jgi:polar amino acid transport system substrate-binding protein
MLEVKMIPKLLLLYLIMALFLRAEAIVLANGEWPPFLSKQLPEYGFASHIVSESFKRVGIDVEYQFVPWKRAETEVKNGKVDGSLVWSQQPERDEFAFFSEPVLQLNEVLFTLKNRSLEWREIADLRGLDIGLALGSTPGVFKQAIEDGEVSLVRTKDIESSFKMLLGGRVDACPVIDSVGHYLLRTKFSDSERERIISSVKRSEVVYYRLMLTKLNASNAQMITKFNQGLKLLKETGRYAEMESDFYQGLYD